MLRKLLSIACFGFACALTVLADDAAAPGDGQKPGGKIDRSKIFEKMDANGDGKVTRDEYKTFMEGVAQKMKDSGKGGKFADKMGQFADIACLIKWIQIRTACFLRRSSKRGTRAWAGLAARAA